MAIQFYCPACQQPIEIDDEYARQAVACPYCQKVVTAPAASTLGSKPGEETWPHKAAAMPPSAAMTPGADMPPGANVSTGAGPRADENLPIFVDRPGDAPNRYATAGFICAGILVVCYLLLLSAMMGYGRSAPADLDAEGMQQFWIETTQNHPWVTVAMFMIVVSALVGTITSILGLARGGPRRWQAVVGLVVCGSMVTCNCLGLLNLILGGRGL